MKIRHLRIFKVVCQEESITRASEKLYISQPAVSNAIIELENDLGIQLFDRISKKIYLNEEGKLFLAKINKLLDLYDDLEESAKLLDKKALIKVGSSITIANFILPKAILEFEKLYPNIRVKVMVANARDIEAMILKNEVDLGLIEGAIYDSDLIKKAFSEYKLSVVCSPENKISLEKNLDINRVIKEKLLLREKGSSIRDVLDSTLLTQNLTIEPEWISINTQSLINAVKANLGITILPRVLVEEELERKQLLELKVEGLDLVNTNHFVFHKDKFQKEVFKDFIGAVEKSLI